MSYPVDELGGSTFANTMFPRAKPFAVSGCADNVAFFHSHSRGTTTTPASVAVSSALGARNVNVTWA